MSTAIVHRSAPAPNMTTASEWNAITAQAAVLARTEIVPKAYQDRPDDIIAAALMGRSVGLDPMLSLQYIHVIEGKPTLSAEAMVALVRRAGHTIEIRRLDDSGAVAYGKRRDTGTDAEFEFTKVHAQAAGLLEKPVWKAYFRSMAWARAVSQLCRVLFADVIMGMSYVPEELGAEVDADGTPEGAAVRAADVPAALQPSSMQPVGDVTPPGVIDVEEVGPGEPGDDPEEFEVPPPPPPPTPEQQHAKDGKALFKTGFPFGDCKGGDMTDPAAVPDKDLDYYLSRGIKDDKWKAVETKRHDWIRRELHRRHLEREAAAAPEFVPAGDPNDTGDDLPFDSAGNPTGYAAERTDGTKARQEAEAQQGMFEEQVTDVEVIDETAPADMPQPEWAAALPDVGVHVDWNDPANSLEAPGLGADVCRYLVAVIVAGGIHPDAATAQASVNSVNAQRIASGDGPLTNRVAVEQVGKIAPRIAGRQAALRG